MNATKKFIVKVQVSVSTTAKTQQCLIYNQDRSLLEEFDITPAINDVMGESHKWYFKAEFKPDGELHINEQVPDQKW